MVVVARRPTVDGEMRGQFDDVLGIQLLRNRFALLAMEAAEKSVQSPIVVPQDVQEIEFGGDSIIRTNNPAGVRRVELPIPNVLLFKMKPFTKLSPVKIVVMMDLLVKSWFIP